MGTFLKTTVFSAVGQRTATVALVIRFGLLPTLSVNLTVVATPGWPPSPL